MPALLEEDLEHVLVHTGEIWEALRGQHLLLTGATGFFGKWLLESFVAAEQRFSLGATAWVLSRNVDRLLATSPHLAAARGLQFITGDIQHFALPPGVAFSHCIHAATPTALRTADASLEILDAVIGGTRHLCELLRPQPLARLLLVSSGAVYGPQPAAMSHVPETYLGGPDPLSVHSAYGEAKRVAEQLCALHAQRGGFACSIARCFAFVGPHLPLDGPYAMGNFIRDGRAGNPIRVRGGGDALRSYLYAADLTVWLWTLLARGQSAAAYNVGSDEEISVANLARQVGAFYGCNVSVGETETQAASLSRYVPNVARARHELGLQVRIDLPTALVRTEKYLRGAQSSPTYCCASTPASSASSI